MIFFGKDFGLVCHEYYSTLTALYFFSSSSEKLMNVQMNVKCSVYICVKPLNSSPLNSLTEMFSNLKRLSILLLKQISVDLLLCDVILLSFHLLLIFNAFIYLLFSIYCISFLRHSALIKLLFNIVLLL